jgi:hypothetical protein
VGGGLIIRLSKTLLNKIFHQEVKNVLWLQVLLRNVNEINAKEQPITAQSQKLIARNKTVGYNLFHNVFRCATYMVEVPGYRYAK